MPAWVRDKMFSSLGRCVRRHPVRVVEFIVRSLLQCSDYTVKKVNDFPVPSRDVTDQTLPAAGIIKLFPSRERLDRTGNGKPHFLQCKSLAPEEAAGEAEVSRHVDEVGQHGEQVHSRHRQTSTKRNS
jgi:hypothetical protein